MAIKHPSIVSRGNLYKVDPCQIIVQENWNPRKEFDTDEDEELFQFIAENGCYDSAGNPTIPPIILQMVDNEPVLRDGERRLRAVNKAISKNMDIQSIPAVFLARNGLASDALLRALSANESKKLKPLEQAEAYNRLRSWDIPVATIAKRMGKSQVHVYSRLKLIDSSEELKAEIKANNITLDEAHKIIKKSEGSIDKQKSGLQNVKKVKKYVFKIDEETGILEAKKGRSKIELTEEEKDLFFGSIGMLTDITNTEAEITMRELKFKPESVSVTIEKEV